jgi:hypothetical protein
MSKCGELRDRRGIGSEIMGSERKRVCVYIPIAQLAGRLPSWLRGGDVLGTEDKRELRLSICVAHRTSMPTSWRAAGTSQPGPQSALCPA